MQMIDPDAIGYAAAALVVATFCMRSMIALRWVAIASNLTFIIYACSARLAPVLVLHALLLPINVVRVFQLSRKAETLQQSANPEIS